jgi:Lrp/AsnC family transcriptional regulator
MEQDIDQYDRRILREIQRDSSRPVTQLAEAVGLSQAPCWRRLQKLREQGFIKGEVALADAKKLGWNLQLFIHVNLNAHGRATVDEFIAAMRGHDQVLACYIVLGNIDILLHVVVRDIPDYQRFFLDQLSKAPGVREINSMTVLSEVKNTTALPL